MNAGREPGAVHQRLRRKRRAGNDIRSAHRRLEVAHRGHRQAVGRHRARRGARVRRCPAPQAHALDRPHMRMGFDQAARLSSRSDHDEMTRVAPRERTRREGRCARRAPRGDLVAVEKRQRLAVARVEQRVDGVHRTLAALAVAGKHRDELDADPTPGAPGRHQQQRCRRRAGDVDRVMPAKRRRHVLAQHRAERIQHSRPRQRGRGSSRRRNSASARRVLANGLHAIFGQRQKRRVAACGRGVHRHGPLDDEPRRVVAAVGFGRDDRDDLAGRRGEFGAHPLRARRRRRRAARRRSQRGSSASAKMTPSPTRRSRATSVNGLRNHSGVLPAARAALVCASSATASSAMQATTPRGWNSSVFGFARRAGERDRGRQRRAHRPAARVAAGTAGRRLSARFPTGRGRRTAVRRRRRRRCCD